MDRLPTPHPVLSPEEAAAFHRDGFVFRRGFFGEPELAPLIDACRADPEVDGALVGIADSQGNMQEVVTWTDLSEGEFLSDVVRLERIVDATEQLLGQPVYHWHSKLSMKRPGSLGRWDWHQDYAYWYHEGCLYPDMLTVTVALDRCDELNGCLKLIQGSHRLGRIEHGKVGQATGVDQERLALIEERHKVVACAMQPGDAVFFHANTLHASGPNVSDRPRTLLHLSYNTVVNSPFVAEGQDHHRYKPLAKLPDDHLARRAWKTLVTGQLFWSTGGGAGRAKGYGYTLLKPARKAAVG
jgi:hypothetical protein